MFKKKSPLDNQLNERMEECIKLVKHNKEISVFRIKLSLELELFGFKCEIPLRW